MSTEIHLSVDKHHNKEIVVIQFDYSLAIVSLLKQNFPAVWSQTKKCWWIERKDFHYRKSKVFLTEKTARYTTYAKAFATRLLEQGTDLPYIQTIPGHGSSKTTEIYTHVSKKSLAKIKSPPDVISTNNNKNNNNLHKTTDK